MKKKDLWLNVVIVVSALVLLYVCVSLASTWISGFQAEQTRNDAADLYYKQSSLQWLIPSACAETMPEQEEPAEDEAAEEEEVELPPIQDDFAGLYELNPHIIGWLKAGESIDHPVVWYDNDYYISHNIKGENDRNGTLFVNAWCSVYPQDDVTMIHGHNMKSGAMFGHLHYFEDYAYLSKHPIVSYRTVFDAEDVYYTPIAAFEVSTMRGEPRYMDIMQFHFEDDADDEGAEINPQTIRQSKQFQAYLDELKERSVWQPLTDVTVDDRLLALITCSYNDVEGRLVVFCRALREGETPESITALYQPAM